jgi:hypothetical protein
LDSPQEGIYHVRRPLGLANYDTTPDLRPEGIDLLVPVKLEIDPANPHSSRDDRQRREAFSDAEKGIRADRSRIRENSECSQIIRILTNSATKILHGVG